MTRTKRLLRENNAFEKQLNPEFNAVLTDMVVYLRSAPVSEYNQELVRRDLGQMFLEAQLRGDGPETVIGGDYRQFCDQVLDQVPRLTARARALDGLPTAEIARRLGLSEGTVRAYRRRFQGTDVSALPEPESYTPAPRPDRRADLRGLLSRTAGGSTIGDSIDAETYQMMMAASRGR